MVSKAADQNHYQAQYNMGVAYGHGHGVEKRMNVSSVACGTVRRLIGGMLSALSNLLARCMKTVEGSRRTNARRSNCIAESR